MSFKIFKHKWTSEKTFRLIFLVEQHQCLWNVESPDFRNKKVRDEAVCAMANLLKLSSDEVKKKIHGLRTQFTNERGKMIKSRRGGGDLSDRYRTKWEFYKALKFMFQHYVKKGTKDHMSYVKDEAIYSMPEDNSTEPLYTTEQSENSLLTFAEAEEASPSSCTDPLLNSPGTDYPASPKVKSFKKSRLSTTEAAINELNAISKTLQQTIPEENEYECFGKLIACQLKKLPEITAQETMAYMQSYLVQKRVEYIQESGKSASYETV